MRKLTPSNISVPDQTNPPIKPEVTVISKPEIGTTMLFINDLPRPHPRLELNSPQSCAISSIVHQYKRLITEGDRLGSKEYHRKRRAHLPLENPYFRAKVSHTITYDIRNTRLVIKFIQCYTASAFLHISGTTQRLSDSEITNFIAQFCAMCANELELYLNAIYLDAISSNYVPCYYGFNFSNL